MIWDGSKPKSGKRATVEHVIPKSQGGTNLLDNLVAACHDCNQRRGVMSHELFKTAIRISRAARRARDQSVPGDIRSALHNRKQQFWSSVIKRAHRISQERHREIMLRMSLEREQERRRKGIFGKQRKLKLVVA
jgi:hypothetical protein